MIPDFSCRSSLELFLCCLPASEFGIRIWNIIFEEHVSSAAEHFYSATNRNSCVLAVHKQLSAVHDEASSTLTPEKIWVFQASVFNQNVKCCEKLFLCFRYSTNIRIFQKIQFQISISTIQQQCTLLPWTSWKRFDCWCWRNCRSWSKVSRWWNAVWRWFAKH